MSASGGFASRSIFVTLIALGAAGCGVTSDHPPIDTQGNGRGLPGGGGLTGDAGIDASVADADTTDTGVDSAACSQGTCAGCCDTFNACQQGNTPSACGLRGALCTACTQTGLTTCDSTGTCQP